MFGCFEVADIFLVCAEKMRFEVWRWLFWFSTFAAPKGAGVLGRGGFRGRVFSFNARQGAFGMFPNRFDSGLVGRFWGKFLEFALD